MYPGSCCSVWRRGPSRAPRRLSGGGENENYLINPFMPTVPTFAVRETDVCRHNGGTSGAPLKPLRDDSALRALSALRGLRGAPEVPPLCRETQSLGQQMLEVRAGTSKALHTRTFFRNIIKSNVLRGLRGIIIVPLLSLKYLRPSQQYRIEGFKGIPIMPVATISVSQTANVFFPSQHEFVCMYVCEQIPCLLWIEND